MATAIGAVIGCLLMARMARKPLAEAPGMGINAMVGAVIGGSFGFAFNYSHAMMLIFISSLIFLSLSFIPTGRDKKGRIISCRERVFDAIPLAIRQATPVGIGLFIAYLGFQNAGLIQSNQFTLLEMVNFTDKMAWLNGGPAAQATVALFGLIIIAVLAYFKKKGAVVVGIISATLLAIPLNVANIDVFLGKTPGISWGVADNFTNFFTNNEVFLSFINGFQIPEGSLFTCLMLILTFIVINLFDTMGTVIGCCKNAGLVDEDGKPEDYEDRKSVV